MTSDAGLVGRGPRYAAELTADMVWEIGHFLLPRLEQATRAHPEGSEEWRTACALEEAVATLVLVLEGSITGGMPGRVRTRVGGPPSPVPSEEEFRVRAEERLERRREDWNTLCRLVGHYRSVPGYQGSRWREIRWRDAERERWYERQLAHRDPESQG